MLLLYTNYKTITRFVHTVGGRISGTDGLGVFVLDPSMPDNRETYTLRNLCDGVVEVQKGQNGPELRVEA